VPFELARNVVHDVACAVETPVAVAVAAVDAPVAEAAGVAGAAAGAAGAVKCGELRLQPADTDSCSTSLSALSTTADGLRWPLTTRVCVEPPQRRPSDEQRFRLDFLPFVERTVQPYGVSIDGIRYYGG
jgi:hypothetical protein